MAENPLLKKLGIKPGQRMLIVDAPEGYVQSLGELPDEAQVTTNPEGSFDFMQVFARSKADVDRQAMAALQALKPGRLLSFAYPKISSKVKTDITRDTGWEALDGAGIRPVTSRRPEMRMSASRLLILVAVILFVLEAVGVSLGGLVWTCSRWAWRSLLARSLCLSSMSTPPTTDRRRSPALDCWRQPG